MEYFYQRRYLGQPVTSNKYSTSTKLANILNKHHPDLNVSNRTVLNELHNIVVLSQRPFLFSLIDTKMYVNLVRSMPTRLNEIIEGNGNKISY